MSNFLNLYVIMIETKLESTIAEVVEQGIKILVKNVGTVLTKIKEEYVPLLDELIKNLTGETKGIAFGKTTELLDMKTLVSMAKQYVTPNSNEIVALRTKEDDGYIIYLAYSKDRQLLPTEDNNYLIIKADALDKDVEALFEESELVILK